MVDCFNTHAPKAEWFSDFFQRKTDFLKDSKLGPEQIVRFRRFLRASNLIVSDKLTEFAYLIERIGWNSDVAWELILCNLAYNPQMVWYIKNLELGRKYSRQEVIDMLVQQGNSVISSKNVAVAFRRISLLPLGTKLNFGQIENNGKILEFITRTKMITPDNRVVLFSLFKFAEACDKYHEFTLSRLMDFTVESDGVSPAEIFSLSVDEMEQILHGLAHSYPDYISFTMTHDLDVIHLSEDKTPEMVLELF